MKNLFKILCILCVISFGAIYHVNATGGGGSIKISKPKGGGLGKPIGKAAKNFDIDILYMSSTAVIDAKAAGTYDYVFSFQVDIKNNDGVKSAILTFDGIYEDGKTFTKNLTPTYDKESGTYKVSLRDKGFEFVGDKAAELPIRLTNTNDDSVVFAASSNFISINTKEQSTDSCDTKFKLKDVNYNSTTSSGIYTMSFSFNFEKNSDIPNSVSLIAQLTNCNGKTSDIQIKLSYHVKTGEYTGSQPMQQDKECNWAISSASIFAYDSCANETEWGIDFEDMKRHGCPCTIAAMVVRSKGR